MIRPPSLTGDYDLVYGGDPALDAPPEPVRTPGEDATSWTERMTKFYDSSEWKAWSERLRIARETGNPEAWQGLLKPGSKPTIFRMQQVPGIAWRKIVGRIPDVGTPEAAALCFRAAIRGFDGYEFKLEWATDKDVGERLATVAVVNALDKIHPGIVSELGNLVYYRMSNPSPLS